MCLFPDERLDEVNDKIRLIQKPDGLTFGTDALLLAAYVNRTFRRAVEFGSGSGIISLLLLSRERVRTVTALDVQPMYAELTARNAKLNGLSDRLSAVTADWRDYRLPPDENKFDLVFSNPPYMTCDSGYACVAEHKQTARHEVFGTVGDLARSAARLLRHGGTLAIVYRPDRLCDLLFALRTAGIEPKRMTFVEPESGAKPSLVLLLSVCGAKPSLKVTRPLILYRDKTHKEYTDDMTYIMNNGIMPPSLTDERNTYER